MRMMTAAVAFTGVSLELGGFAMADPPNPQLTAQSVNATRTISTSKVIPAPEPTFGGVINNDASASTAWWPPKIVPPPGAPNVLLVIVDDAGFASWDTFGGLIPTPVQDGLATEGLRYTNFHTTSLCSPTRAALITGRNHHSVGTGVITEITTGFPGYDGIIGKENATVGRILQANGYATAWFGKEHNTPPWEMTVNGPFDQWPIGMGFDYFYGFVGAEANQWAPAIYENTTPLFPSVGHPGYNFNIDMADKAIAWLKRVNAIEPQRPVFLYYAPGATHAPHQPTAEWIAKFKGKFDAGWNAYREMAFARQKQLGVVPAGAQLTPWPDFLPKWDSLSAQQKKLCAREMEVYAAYLAETDYEIGRVIDAFKETHRYGNTLTILIDGDNGASAEGGMNGTFNELLALNAIPASVADNVKHLDQWGGPDSQPHYAVPWAWAVDTPFKWTKQVASYFGGTRNGMVIAWPNHIGDRGGIRNEFSHVVDIAPTILEAAGIVEPEMVDGVAQRPIEGTSLVYTFDKANADAPSRHRTQYFEMFGNRAIYHDGWIAGTVPVCAPWELVCNDPNAATPFEGAKWELYDVSTDWTQYRNVAAQYPAKLDEMRQLFATEAVKYNVLPLNSDKSARTLAPRPSLTAGRQRFEYDGVLSNLYSQNAPITLDSSYTITARIGVARAGSDGVIVTNGDRFGGYVLMLLKSRPVFAYNMLGLETTKWSGVAPLSPGDHTLVFSFASDGGIGKGGLGTLAVDGTIVAKKRLARTIPYAMPFGDGFSVGLSNASTVTSDYAVPFDFSGTLHRVVVEIQPNALTAWQKSRLQKARDMAWAASE